MTAKRPSKSKAEHAERRQDWIRYMEAFRADIQASLEENNAPKLSCMECNKEIARASILHHHTIQGCKQMHGALTTDACTILRSMFYFMLIIPFIHFNYYDNKVHVILFTTKG